MIPTRQLFRCQHWHHTPGEWSRCPALAWGQLIPFGRLTGAHYCQHHAQIEQDNRERRTGWRWTFQPYADNDTPLQEVTYDHR